jgi:hypothetical protein
MVEIQLRNEMLMAKVTTKYKLQACWGAMIINYKNQAFLVVVYDW